MAILKKIEDERYISNLFRNLSKRREVAANINFENIKHEAVLCFSLKKGNEPFIKLLNIDNPIKYTGSAEVTFCHGDVIFLFQTKILNIFNDECIIEAPKTVYSSFRRMLSRYTAVPDDGIIVCPNNKDKEFQVKNISSGGLSFIAEAESFETGMVLKNSIVKLGNDAEIHVDGTVRHTRQNKDGSIIAGIRFSYINISDYRTLCNYLFNKAYPVIRPSYEFSSGQIWKLVQKSGLIRKTYENDAYRYFNNGYELLKIITENPLVACSLAQCKGDELSGLASVIRVYNRTFLGQNFISDPETRVGASSSTDIYMALADFMLSNAYCDYYFKYIDADLSWHHELFLNIEGIINDRDKFLFDKLVFFECKTNEINSIYPSEGYSCEALYEPDEFIAFCKEQLSLLETGCYGFGEAQQFYMDEIAQIYRAMGLGASRRLWRIMKGSVKVAYAVAEEYPEEFNIISLVNSCRIYFTTIGVDIKETFRALVPELAVFYRKTGKERFYLLLKAWEKVAKDVELPGITYKSLLGRIVMNREGLSEYKKLLMDSFVHYTRYYPLTHPQLAIWYTEKVYPGTGFANIVCTTKFKGKVDYRLLETAINLAIQKNDGIRLRIIEIDNTPRQYVKSHKYVKVDFFDFSLEAGEESFNSWIEQVTSVPFNLIDSNLYYFAIYKMNEKESGFCIKTHHLVSDGWSNVWMISKIMEYYSKLKNNTKVTKKSKPTYLDFIQSEEEFMNSKRFNAQKAFWDKKFDTIPEFISLKPSVAGYRSTKAERKSFVITKDLTLKIYKFCEETKISPFSVFISALYIYINRVTGKKDMVIGTPIINRATQREKETYGMFVSMVPVRMVIDPETDFLSYLNSVSKEWMLILKNQKYPYDLILKDFRERHKVLDNLFDISISYQNAKLEINELTGDYEMKWHFTGSQTDSLQIHISDRGSDGQFELDFDYLVDAFCLNEIERIFKCILNILEDGIDFPFKKLTELELINYEDRQKLLYSFNDTKADYPQDKTIFRLFEEQVKKAPDNIAAVFRNYQLTYRELNQRANQVAWLLAERGIKADDIVAIMVDPSLEMLIGILGIIKAGGAYLPIDPEYPDDRVLFMLEDSKADILLTQNVMMGRIPFKGETIDLNNSELFKTSIDDLNPECLPNNLAYVIYTSGSTGKPKGVLIEHRSLVNLCFWHNNYYCVTEKDRATKYAGFGFDASVWEIFPYIITGAGIYIVDKETKLDINKLLEFFNANGITISFLPTQICEQFMQYECPSLRKLLTGGDKLRYFTKNNYNVVNNYGPTEYTVVTTCFDVEKYHSNIPIGKPIANTKVYVLDKNCKMVPAGIEGELCISGAGIARGYLFRDELTKDRFVPNPYAQNELMYKTGDTVRWLEDGNIEFVGRIDHQVKIRGFRIELGEIENMLSKHDDVRETIVEALQDENGNKYLCAYIVTDHKVSCQELKEYLLKVLPDYMVPAHFVRIDKIPLTPNGKIDRKALPEPEDTLISNESYEAPRNGIEEKLVEVWQEVLNIRQIGINDNFYELGGDSIRAIQVSAALHKYGLSLEIQDLLKNPRIKELSSCIGTINSMASQDLVEGEIELSPIQKWFFEKNFSDKHHFNQAFMLYNKKGYNIEILKQAFSEVIKHHDALRIVFKAKDSKTIQYNRNINERFFDFYIFDFSSEENFVPIIMKEAERIQGSFKLSEGPLVKLGLFKTKNGEHLLIVIHHLVVDGVSWRILFEDFATAYESISNKLPVNLPDKSNSFKEWTQKLKSYANSRELLKQIPYWTKLEDCSILPLPKDSYASMNKQKDSRNVSFKLSVEQTEKLLKQVHYAYNTEINDILLTALGITIKNWAGIDRVLINLEGHGRERIIRNFDISRTVGWFTSIYPVILDMTYANDLSYQIKHIKEDLRKIPDKGVAYGILQYLTDTANLDSLRFSLKPEISFNYLGQFDQDINTKSFTLSDIPVGALVSQNAERLYVFDIFALVSNGEMTFTLNYNALEFKEETIKDLIDHFQSNINKICEHCLSKDDSELTPADLCEDGLTLEELDEISNMLDELF